MNNLIRYLSIFTIGMYAQINSSASYAMDRVKYDPTHRPPDVQKIIDNNFNLISSRSQSYWTMMNGNEHYHVFNINEHLLFKSLIIKSPKQNIFNVLDIGGGLFQWGHALANFLDNDKELAIRDFKVNIINTCGEQYQGQKIKYTSKCTIYNLGKFKVENLKESLNKEGLFTKDETFDFIISSWCLRHLTDPMGTVIQAYNLLGSKRLMLFDGFCHSLALPDEGHPLKGITVYQANCFMIKSFLDMEIPFLMALFDVAKSINQFMLQKSGENIQRLPYGFDGIHDTGEYTEHCSRYYLKFNGYKSKNNMNEIGDKFRSYKENYYKTQKGTLLMGSKLVFDYINESDISASDPIILFDWFRLVGPN